MKQIDSKSKYSNKVVNAEAIFEELLFSFNPQQLHQDSQEFLSLLLNNINDETNILENKSSEEGDKWEEVGNKKEKLLVQNDMKS